MLVLTRNEGQRIIIGDRVAVVLVRAFNGKARFGIEAPAGVPVHRQEVFDAIHAGDGVPHARHFERLNQYGATITLAGPRRKFAIVTAAESAEAATVAAFASLALETATPDALEVGVRLLGPLHPVAQPNVDAWLAERAAAGCQLFRPMEPA